MSCRAAVEFHTAADPPTVYAVLRDGPTWPTWIDIDTMEIETEGESGGESVGAIRLVHFRRAGKTFTTREQVVELVPDRRFSYSLVSGLPLRDYRADVDLTPSPGGGTDIRWAGSWRPAIPGTGLLTRLAVRHLYRQFSKGLIAKVEG